MIQSTIFTFIIITHNITITTICKWDEDENNKKHYETLLDNITQIKETRRWNGTNRIFLFTLKCNVFRQFILYI
jgi:hypothetical protein